MKETLKRRKLQKLADTLFAKLCLHVDEKELATWALKEANKNPKRLYDAVRLVNKDKRGTRGINIATLDLLLWATTREEKESPKPNGTIISLHR